MFQLGQIITATQFVKGFSKITRYLKYNPEPVAIMQKSGQILVLITAEMFDDLAREKLRSQGIEPPPADLRDLMNKKFY